MFIEFELKDKIKIFDKVYSCVDYFKIGGKTRSVYENVCKELNVKPSEVLHVGDSKLMDVDNAKLAGFNAVLFNGDIKNVINEIKGYMEG